MIEVEPKDYKNRTYLSAIEAADLKRNGIGYEIVPEIANDAIKDLKNYQTKLW